MRLRKDVVTFAKAMEGTLKQHDDRPGWENETEEYLIDRLEGEFKELQEAAKLWRETDEPHIWDNREGIKHELVDIANFCMMAYCNIERFVKRHGLE